MINTFVATAAAALSWMFAEWLIKGKASLLGALSGCIAGLVAVTPAAGYAGPMGAIVLGLIAGVVCLFFCTTIKNMLGYDDALDVFGVHCIGGIIGAILTGILVNPALGGAGIMDYAAPAAKIADYEFGTQLVAQIKAVLVTLVWSGVGSFILYKVVDILVGLRVSVEQEREGLDLTDHGERAYNDRSSTRHKSDTVRADTRHRPCRRGALAQSRAPHFWEQLSRANDIGNVRRVTAVTSASSPAR